MGILNKLGFGGGKGDICTKNEDGSKTCTVFEVKGSEKLATGSVVTFGLDQNCNPVFAGDTNSILDQDEEHIGKIIKREQALCRKGIA